MQGNGSADTGSHRSDTAELSMGKHSIAFYETLLNMWIVTGRQVRPGTVSHVNYLFSAFMANL